MTVVTHPGLRVGVYAALLDETSGGVRQFVMGLADGLSKLADGGEEYLFFTRQGADDWLRPYISGPCRILAGRGAPWPSRLKRGFGLAFPTVRKAWHMLKANNPGQHIRLPRSDGTMEKAGVELIHFPTQEAFLTEVPSIYHPWDLQHLHLPQFFSPWVRRVRDFAYRTFCEQARMVSVATSWTKQDLVRHFGLPEEKIEVIPGAPLLHVYPTPTAQDLESVRTRFGLREAFAFYPAQTYPHKNHARLLEALAALRDHYGLTIPFVFSGILSEYFGQVKRHVRRLRLVDQVRFLGFVTPLELQCLYRLCRCMVFPSEFEGFAFPVTEAFLAGAPTACSTAACLPELAGDAAVLFDPEDLQQMAEAVRRVWTDDSLRRTLVERGYRNVARYSWQRTAKVFRAHYRRLAQRPLAEEDRALIGAPIPV